MRLSDMIFQPLLAPHWWCCISLPLSPIFNFFFSSDFLPSFFPSIPRFPQPSPPVTPVPLSPPSSHSPPPLTTFLSFPSIPPPPLFLLSFQAREQYIYPGDKNSMVKWKLQVVLTKCDLVERFELARRIQVIKQKVSAIFLIT
jgi:hypothetical protein